MKLPRFSGKLKKPKLPILLRRVVGHSMVPVLPPGILVFGVSYFGKIKPGQVVILQHEGHEKIKRISQVDGDKIFVLGDHPGASTDSRQFGWIDKRLITARIIWPSTKKA